MTCIRLGKAFVCCNTEKLHRLHVGKKYYWLEMHRYFGPVFWEDMAATKEFFPTSKDPIWKAFEKWKKRHTPCW